MTAQNTIINCPGNTHILLAKLLEGIERWAAEEDGIPDWLQKTYERAKAAINEPAPRLRPYDMIDS